MKENKQGYKISNPSSLKGIEHCIFCAVLKLTLLDTRKGKNVFVQMAVFAFFILIFEAVLL